MNFKQASAISAWLVIGNAGALVLCAKALIDGADCAIEVLQTSALCFAIGLLLTMAGTIMGSLTVTVMLGQFSKMLTHLQGVWISEAHIDELERQNIPVPDDNPLRTSNAADESGMLKATKSAHMIAFCGITLASVLTVAGSVAFAIGLLSPLLSPDMLGQCVAASAAQVASSAAPAS